MKHLKTFEKLNIKAVELKKYVIWSILTSPINRCSILEVIFNDKYTAVLKRIYTYDLLTNSQIDDSLMADNIFEYSPRHVKENIIFESDNIQDCYDFIETLKISKKYNL